MLFCPRCDKYAAEYYGNAPDGPLDLHICEACGFKFENRTIHVSPYVLRNFAPDKSENAEDESAEDLGRSGGLDAR